MLNLEATALSNFNIGFELPCKRPLTNLPAPFVAPFTVEFKVIRVA